MNESSFIPSKVLLAPFRLIKHKCFDLEQAYLLLIHTLLLLQGLYQFLRPPSSSSSPLPRSSPVSIDYSKFGTAASPAIIPDDSASARWVSLPSVMFLRLKS